MPQNVNPRGVQLTPTSANGAGYAMGKSRREQMADLNTTKSRGAALGDLGRIATRLAPRAQGTSPASPRPQTAVTQSTTPGRRRG